MDCPKGVQVKGYQIIVYAVKSKETDMLSVFEDADVLANFLDCNEDFVKSIEWIKPVITVVKAPGVKDE